MKYKSFFVFLSFALLFTFSNCQNPASEKETSNDKKESIFSVDDASYLYFKNVRAYHYKESPGPGTNSAERMNLYRLRKFSENKDRPILYPIIVDNWIKDEAYLFIEQNEFRSGFKVPLTVLAVEGQDTSRIELTQPNTKAQYDFVRMLQKRLDATQSLFILDTAGVARPVFTDKQDKLHFMTTLQDYQQLTEK